MSGIEKLRDGTYLVTLGIADGVNKNGITFSRKVMEQEVARINKLAERLPVRSEMGYPARDSRGQWEYLARLGAISEERVCASLSELEIVEGSDGQPPTIVGIVTPSGPYKDVMIGLLDADPPAARFGYRAYTFPRTVDGEQIQHVENIVTWDLIPI